MSSATTLKSIRLLHHYSGVFLAPAILFFAITGGLQMFGLHETSRGSSYVPPAILVHLAQLHKKGTLFVPQRKPSASASGPKLDAPKPDGERGEGGKDEGAKPDQPKQQPFTPPQNPHNPLPIKIFFAITAIGLVVSTLTGLFMAWKYTRRKSIVAGVFLAGIIIPVVLLFL